VLNLSFGTDSVQDERLDPLSYAVEAAWRAGIVVDVAAGNDGVAHAAVTMPAADPYVIAVGSADTTGTDGKADDLVSAFSTGGSAARHPDLLAPGRSVASLRDPQSFVDLNNPGGLIATDPAQRYFRGSGTSQATAVVSGAVALLLQQRPSLTPDQVKALLTGTAAKLDPRKAPLSTNPLAQGAGELDLGKALDTPTPPGAGQGWAAASGTGSLEASRGSAFVQDPVTGTELHGEQDVMGQAWDPAAAWSGDTWNGRVWDSATLPGTDWAGTAWSSQPVDDTAWTDSGWTGRSWTGRSWTGRSWTGRSWTGEYWSTADWE
jgi:serine protease AprX